VTKFLNRLDRLQGFSYEVSGGKLRGWVDYIQKMVRNCSAQLWKRFVSTNIEAAVNLDGITVYDFAAKTAGQMDSGDAFPHPSGAEKENNISSFRKQFLSG